MAQEINHEFWGMSLSLKPPITHLDHHKPIICKREPQILTDEEKPKKQKANYEKAIMMVPKINNIGIEIKPPLVVDLEDLEITSKVIVSPNSTLSSTATGKHLGGYKFNGGQMMSDEDEGGNGGGSCGGDRSGDRKKLRLSKAQIMVLEQAFREHTTLNTKQKMELAKQVHLRPRQVEVWFQNRRARTKLKQIEVDCEYLRSYCEKLREENKKLEKEVQQLRALKASASHHPPTTLATCPSCISSSTPVAQTTPSPCSLPILYRPPPLYKLRK
ncbi:unnamed protein product [Amaranthus hypochondriacus]